MATLQAQLAQVITTTPRQSDDNTATPSLHSLSARPHYEWTPSEAHQVNMLHMDVPIHTSKPMTSADRKSIIEAYPPVAQLEYRSPATVPSAEQSMNKVQKMEDNPLLNYRAQGHWTVKEAAQSINRREELKAAHLALKTFHMPPNSTVLIRTDNTTNSRVKEAPPVNIHRPTIIDVSPAIAFVQSIASRTTTSIKRLQQKLAFLLLATMAACLLRPSDDMARTPFASCFITDTDCFSFQVVAPKETRGKRRRIIKPFTVHPRMSDIELCPVRCFKALQDHPGLAAHAAGSQFFVKSHNILAPLSSSTIFTWLLHKEFIQLCTSEPKVSIRSLASSRALELGVSRDHIVITLGNWASSSTFQNHYQRNQMAHVGFTSTVLSEPMDQFFDAPDEFSGSA
ncbi:hypothetical protein PS6_010174 [Mucor atramentarius]